MPSRALLTQRLTLAAMALVVAACVGGRRPRGGVVAPSPTDSAARRDSIAVPRDSAGNAPTISVTPSVRADSAPPRKAGADSAAGGTATSKTKAAKKAPATRECILDFADSPPETRMRYQRLPDSTGLTFIGGGFVGHCQGEKNVIRADSAEQYQSAGTLNLFGNVVYTEPGKLQFVSQHATYFTREERIFADGNVVATQLASGSTFSGPNIEYFRPLAGVRTGSRLVAPNRPTARLEQKDSVGKPLPSVVINANTMVDDADSVIYAWGDVQINRQSLLAESDSARFSKAAETARLIRNARIRNRDKAQPFRLFGDTIDLFSANRKLERIVALHNGVASSDDFTMKSERLDMRLADQKLTQAYASGTGDTRITTSTQELVADSMAVRMPDQHVRELRAIGKAVATGVSDTLKIRSTDRDILRGDTVTAWFDSTMAHTDTTQRTSITEIHATGTASSLFQMASKQGPKAPPALNYVRGHRIQIYFDSGQVRNVLVDSAANGLYLEPEAEDSLSDSTAKAPAKGPPGKGTPAQAAPAKAAPTKAPPAPKPPPIPDRAVMESAASSFPRRRS